MSLDSLQIKEFAASATNSQSTFLYLSLNMQNPDGEKSVITAVNNLLSNGKTRLKGLELLKDLILYCSYDVFTENALNWASHCMVHHVEDSSKEIKLNTLAKILENSTDIDLFNKKFASEYLSITLKACLTSQPNEKLSCLKCLSQCMKRYPTWFSNHKQKVETLLIESLDSPSEEVTKQGAVAFIYFLETGGAGVNGINYINNFSCQFKKLCATIQSLYDIFLEGVPEINNTTKIEGEVFTFKKLLDANKIFEVSGNRIINCLIFLETLIAKSYSVEKRIVPKFVVDIICRGLSVHLCFSKGYISDEDSKKSISLRKIQMRLFRLLRIFILGYHSSLLPFSYELKKTLASILKRTDACNCYTYDLLFKTQMYKTLQSWLTFSKNVSETYLEDVIVPVVVKDISPARKNVLLNLDVSKTKSKSAKKNQLEDSVTNKRMLVNSDSYNKGNSCIHALETLKCLLKRSCLSRNQTLLQEIVSVLTRITTDVQINKVVPPYTDPKCQTKLYEVLIAIFSQENVHSIPSLHSMISIFTNGVQSSNHGIAQMSMEGLDLIEKISQPVCASLYIADSKSASVRATNTSDLLNLETDLDVVELDETEDNAVSNVFQENGKKINVISDILISVPIDVKAHEEDDEIIVDVVEDDDKTKKKTIEIVEDLQDDHKITNKTIEIMEDEQSEDKLKNETIVIDNSFDVEMVEEPHKAEIEEGVDDMFDSFKDIVQE